MRVLYRLEKVFRDMMADGLENSELYYETFWAVLGQEGINFDIGSADGRMADSNNRSGIPGGGSSTAGNG